ncbi:hypothetical protein K1719_002379 [Acacia pycnantha]|nr:hypothetical protein K1719_002379 [Acacia pycnantha]
MAMKNHKLLHFLPLFIITIFPSLCLSLTLEDAFFNCFAFHLGGNPNSSSQLIITQNNTSYQPLLQSSIRNLRFSDTSSSSTPKPKLIVTPKNVIHIQSAVVCSKQQGLQVRVRSGGHDYEGLSYTSDYQNQPFIIIDLSNVRSITVNLEDETAWVEAGATVGELYHAIASKSYVLGFPAGSCPTVGVGGHISGGGFGTIFRKYGLAADNVVDVIMVDSNGMILNRTIMGEDLFWAVRGGGGSSFGVITAYKVNLVRVPPTVTIFEISRTLQDEDASTLFEKWQNVADKLPGEMFLHAVMGVGNVTLNNGSSSKILTFSFSGLYLGEAENVTILMNNTFPELNLQRNNCMKMSWIQSVVYFAGYSMNTSMDVLLQRNQTFRSFKAKSDYVTQPIPKFGLQGLWNILLEENQNSPVLIFSPYGGKMREISDSETPFPHRNGIIYGIQYLVYWDYNEETDEHAEWMRRLYEYMKPYVSKNPRAAYLNYRDLDLGVNRGGGNGSSYEEARSSWGRKYFKNNFERLAKVKAAVDGGNFFRNEQSIPPLFTTT